MKVFSTHPVGLQQGEIALFSDFENGGEMWTGTGPRECRKTVQFSSPFREAPAMHLTISLWDVDTGSAVRAELQAENVTRTGFDAVFRTWADTRVARLRVAWLAIGEAWHEDDWDIS